MVSSARAYVSALNKLISYINVSNQTAVIAQSADEVEAHVAV